MSFTARFPTPRAAATALDLDQVVSAYGRSATLREILYAVRIARTGYADWMIVAPGEILGAYRDTVEARARAGDLSNLRHRVVTVLPCC